MLDNLRAVAAARRALLEDDGVSPFGTVVERVISATEGVLDGRRTILAGTNNYLGLTFDPDCIEAACAALRAEG
ncbi:MAG: 8-amino-7-oxononanoate synthase, partial [Candidatus Rokuibacteriota bacterium]